MQLTLSFDMNSTYLHKCQTNDTLYDVASVSLFVTK